ncbi:uncharacterized protein LOC119670208 [Teleopsis dalmanni]|uniref:uncharacterized protein LOC119670208 n=1 Tax=Teleopsis dalmanni TaxID=139649 RepID=UPI0018CCF33B|nr:uncharacterized protein LOC119670208 [Teleopsis dalmanni]XP_037936304.1 uncharacterized protein LOC119670208 [Teleopsis dalmanni]XP_037936305.1 uncharacterized protein LOC119670208 [Teleopsis dalmanni]XP_037936306.1 uncharacterized protein LOC119670208 [Teleopsis dalmanni]XP_037936307.1 uncharacterized protein LOC119670208 [Teleopsis dalmanni]
MHERRVKKIKSGHYVATHGRLTPDPPYVHSNRGYSTDGEESHRAPSERTMSEYTIAHERSSPHGQHYNSSRKSRVNISQHTNNTNSRSLMGSTPMRTSSVLSYDHGGDAGSDIYVTSGAYKAPSEISRYSHRPHSRGGPRSVYSVASTAKTGRSSRSTTKRGAKIETMSAPNPFCPNIKGVCCLMLLLNLGLILVTLGFVIVVQFYEPLYVWVLGIIFLVFGFLTLIGCMVYCVYVCHDAKTPSQIRNEDLYWTRHWQKNIGYTPQEINYKADKYDAYSDRYSVSKISGKYSDRESNRY